MASTVTHRPDELAPVSSRIASRAPTRPAWPLELGLFLHALRLAWVARKIRRREPLERLVEQMNGLSFLPRRVEVRSAVRAATRACVRLRRWLGGPDTCLVRSLIAGSLLSDRNGVVLHLGLLPPVSDEKSAAGHAWLSVAGELVETTGDVGSRYPEIHRIELRRPGD